MTILPETQLRRYVLIEYVGGRLDGETAVVEISRDGPPREIRVPVRVPAYFGPSGSFAPPALNHAEYRIDMPPGGEYFIVHLTEQMVAQYSGSVADIVRHKAGPHVLTYRLQE